MAKTTPPRDETPFIADEVKDTETPASETPTEYVQKLKEGYQTFPVPTTSAGKGKKYCPNCNFLMGARSVDCNNCNFHIIKGAKKVVTGRTITHKPATEKAAAPEAKVDKYAVLRVLSARGFDLVATANILDPKAVPTISTSDKVLDKVLKLIDFGSEINKLDGKGNGLQLVQTTPSIMFTMDLDTLLAVFGLPERR